VYISENNNCTFFECSLLKVTIFAGMVQQMNDARAVRA